MTGTNSTATSRSSTGPPRYAYPPEVIRAARQRRHLAQWELAARVGGSRRSVHRWETEGVPVGARRLGAIEEVLGLGAYADPPTESATRPAAGAPEDLSVMQLFAALAAKFAALEARAAAAPPALSSDLYRWNSADAPTIRRGGLGHRADPVAVSQSDLA